MSPSDETTTESADVTAAAPVDAGAMSAEPARRESMDATDVADGMGEAQEQAPQTTAIARTGSHQAERDRYIARVVEARDELGKVEKRHADDIQNAEQTLKRTQSEYDSGIKRAKAVLDQIDKDYARQVSSFSGITLFQDRFEFQGKTIPLTSQTNVRAEASGSIEANPEVVDSRKLILTLTTADGIYQVATDPDKGEQARSFVRDCMSLVPSADVRSAERAQKTTAAEARLKEAEQNTMPIKNAEEWLSKVKADDTEVRGAKRTISELDRSATADQRSALRDYDKGRRRRKLIVWGVVIAVVLVGAMVAFFVMRSQSGQ